MTHILAIDDEPDMLRFLQRGLSSDGHRVTVTPDGVEGVRLARQIRPFLVILDLVMPRIGGREVLRQLVAGTTKPRVIVLSGVRDVETRVDCLESGAADFLTKPFAFKELRARVHAQTRSIDSPNEQRLTAGRLVLDRVTRTLVVDGREVSLTTRECQLLSHLMSRPDIVCSREELLAEVWELSFDPGTNVVDACVRRLRSKMDDDTIETVRNVGYTLRSA